jgi:hypothetical protein
MKPRKAIIILGAVFAAYLLAFFFVFEPLSSPCRTKEEWISPKLRFDDAYIDIGKIFEYQKERSASYSVFYPLCRVWLFANGIS